MIAVEELAYKLGYDCVPDGITVPKGTDILTQQENGTSVVKETNLDIVAGTWKYPVVYSNSIPQSDPVPGTVVRDIEGDILVWVVSNTGEGNWIDTNNGSVYSDNLVDVEEVLFTS